MSERETERDLESPRPDDDLLEEQEGQGYGEDEGERDDALESEDA